MLEIKSLSVAFLRKLDNVLQNVFTVYIDLVVNVTDS